MSSEALGPEVRQRGASPAFPVPSRSKGADLAPLHWHPPQAAGRWEWEQSGIRALDHHHLRLHHRSKESGSPPVHTYLAQCTKLQREGTHTARWSNQHPCSLRGLLGPLEEDPILILIRENDLRPTVSNFILVAHSSNKPLVSQIIESFDEIPETPAEIAADDLLRRAPLYRKARHPNMSQRGGRAWV